MVSSRRYGWLKKSLKISMVFQGAMNSLDPVYTIKEQFLEILKQHNFDGDVKQVISDAIPPGSPIVNPVMIFFSIFRF